MPPDQPDHIIIIDNQMFFDYEKFLKNSICMSLMVAGVVSDGGKLPACLGIKCSAWYGCMRDVATSVIELNKTLIDGRKPE
jgi:hypothetical protein